MADTLTLEDSRADGIAAAAQWMEAGELQPEHFTNPGADAWGEEGCNVGDAAFAAWPTSRHRLEVESHREAWEARGRWGSCPDWDDSHWDFFVDGFEDEARRLAQQRGWEWSVGAEDIHIHWKFQNAWVANLELKGIATLQDLRRATDAELLSIKGIGKKALADLRKFQREWGDEQGAAANG